MDGYLNEYQVKKIVDLGLDIEKIYEDDPQRYWIRVKTRPATPKEIKEDEELDENSIIILDTKVVIKNVGICPNDTRNIHYYLSIPLNHLVEFLSKRLLGGFTISCLYPKANRAYLPYTSIQYMDKKKQIFIPTNPLPFSLEELLCNFLEFLLKNKAYLIRKSFFD